MGCYVLRRLVHCLVKSTISFCFHKERVILFRKELELKWKKLTLLCPTVQFTSVYVGLMLGGCHWSGVKLGMVEYRAPQYKSRRSREYFYMSNDVSAIVTYAANAPVDMPNWSGGRVAFWVRHWLSFWLLLDVKKMTTSGYEKVWKNEWKATNRHRRSSTLSLSLWYTVLPLCIYLSKPLNADLKYKRESSYLYIN